MSDLVQLIYSSVAKKRMSGEGLAELLRQARHHNMQCGITGMLLYADGSFFQVLEGEAAEIDKLFETISRDRRHEQVTLIIHEPIAKRAFGDWTMGYADITAQEADAILGTNDFFDRGESFTCLAPGRAKKLLDAFKQGSWRERLSDTATPTAGLCVVNIAHPERPSPLPVALPLRQDYSFAYQPIIDVDKGAIFSYEALIRGLNRESAEQVLAQITADKMHAFDEQSRNLAVRIAAGLGLSTRINLNVLPRSLMTSPTVIASLLDTADENRIQPEQIVLEILEREIINDVEYFASVINEYRGSGLVVAIDDFGSGYAGLNLLADFQPNLIKLDMHLVRGIDARGPRQAIVRGALRTCLDLGIDVIAEGVETLNEFAWLHKEGITLFQGNLFARPAFEALPVQFNLPC